MLDQILNIIKSQASGAITSNPEIPEDKKAETIQTTTQAVAEGLKNQLSMSNLTNLASLFSNDVKSSTTMNPLIESIKNTVSTTLTQKTGLPAGIANGIAASVVPSVFKVFSQKVNDPNENEKGFNMEGLLKTFTGGNEGNEINTGSLLSSVGKLFH